MVIFIQYSCKRISDCSNGAYTPLSRMSLVVAGNKATRLKGSLWFLTLNSMAKGESYQHIYKFGNSFTSLRVTRNKSKKGLKA